MRHMWIRRGNGRIEGYRRFAILLTVSVFFLTGCGNAKPKNSERKAVNTINNDMKNVEQRGYATIIVISDGEDGNKYHFDLGIAQEKHTGEKSEKEKLCSFDCDSFRELSEKYRLVKGNDLSLAHLKIILLSQIGENGLLRKETYQADYLTTELGELLQEMDENEEIAKTCPVLQLEDRDTFLDDVENAEEPVGTYISNLVRTGERQGEKIPWLKDYLKMLREEEKIAIYSLETVSEGFTLNKVKDKGNTYDK